MVPSWNFTVRPAPFEAAPVAAARADALDSAAIIALTAGSDEPSAAQSPLNSRRLSNCLFISSIFIVRSFALCQSLQLKSTVSRPNRKLLDCITGDGKFRASTTYTNTVTIKATTTKGKAHVA